MINFFVFVYERYSKSLEQNCFFCTTFMVRGGILFIVLADSNPGLRHGYELSL